MSEENIRVMTTPKGTKYFVNRSYILTMFSSKQNIYEKNLFIEYVINLQDKLIKLEQENKQLKEDKKKAREYINIFKDDIRGLDEYVLLDILGDKENE